MVFEFCDCRFVGFGDGAFVVAEDGDLAVCFCVGREFVDDGAVFGSEFAELVLEGETCVEGTEYFCGEARHQFT